MKPEAFWVTIVITMVIVFLLAFIGLYKSNQAPNNDPLSFDQTWGVFITALMIGVGGGGGLGFLIWVISQSFR